VSAGRSCSRSVVTGGGGTPGKGKKENSPRGGLAWMDGLTGRPAGPGTEHCTASSCCRSDRSGSGSDPIAFWRCFFAARRVVAVDDVEDGLELDAIRYASLERA